VSLRNFFCNFTHLIVLSRLSSYESGNPLSVVKLLWRILLSIMNEVSWMWRYLCGEVYSQNAVSRSRVFEKLRSTREMDLEWSNIEGGKLPQLPLTL
jgi:hypothetical protein